jgi:hypothetical protein
MLIYDIFAVIAAIGGIYSGFFFFNRTKRYFKVRKLVGVLMVFLAISSFWLGGVYLLTACDILAAPSLTIGLYTRPAIMSQLWLTALIFKGLNL